MVAGKPIEFPIGKMYFLLNMGIFHHYLSFPKCATNQTNLNIHYSIPFFLRPFLTFQGKTRCSTSGGEGVESEWLPSQDASDHWDDITFLGSGIPIL